MLNSKGHNPIVVTIKYMFFFFFYNFSNISFEYDRCYICLAEYEEGDQIRVLPCLHEYHMSCVDKWLKEIHGYCHYNQNWYSFIILF